MAGTLSVISIILYIAAGLFAAAAAILWFVFKISTVVGDLSGRNARKSIEKMRAENERDRKKKSLSSQAVAASRKAEKTAETGRKVTGSPQEYETALLDGSEGQSRFGMETELLVEAETGELGAEPMRDMPVQNKGKGSVKLKMIDEVMCIHTDEII